MTEGASSSRSGRTETIPTKVFDLKDDGTTVVSVEAGDEADDHARNDVPVLRETEDPRQRQQQQQQQPPPQQEEEEPQQEEEELRRPCPWLQKRVRQFWQGRQQQQPALPQQDQQEQEQRRQPTQQRQDEQERLQVQQPAQQQQRPPPELRQMLQQIFQRLLRQRQPHRQQPRPAQQQQQGQQSPPERQVQQEEQRGQQPAPQQQDQQPAQEKHVQQVGEERRRERPPQEGAQRRHAAHQRRRYPREPQQPHPQQNWVWMRNFAQQGRFMVHWEGFELVENPNVGRELNPEPEPLPAPPQRPEPEPPPGQERRWDGEPSSSTADVGNKEEEGKEESRQGRGGIAMQRLGQCSLLYDPFFFFGGSDLDLFCWFMRHTFQAKSTYQHIEIMEAAHLTGGLIWGSSNDLFLVAERKNTATTEATARRLYITVLVSASCLRTFNQAIVESAVIHTSRARDSSVRSSSGSFLLRLLPGSFPFFNTFSVP